MKLVSGYIPVDKELKYPCNISEYSESTKFKMSSVHRNIFLRKNLCSFLACKAAKYDGPGLIVISNVSLSKYYFN